MMFLDVAVDGVFWLFGNVNVCAVIVSYAHTLMLVCVKRDSAYVFVYML